MYSPSSAALKNNTLSNPFTSSLATPALFPSNSAPPPTNQAPIPAALRPPQTVLAFGCFELEVVHLRRAGDHSRKRCREFDLLCLVDRVVDPASRISGRCPTLICSGFEIPPRVSTRTSRTVSFDVSAIAVTRATTFFSSRAGAARFARCRRQLIQS